jgi:hypothetical protein
MMFEKSKCYEGCKMFRKIQDKLYSLRDEWKYDFYDCIRDIAEHPVVLRMKLSTSWHDELLSALCPCGILQLSVVPFFSFRCKIGGERGDAS